MIDDEFHHDEFEHRFSGWWITPTGEVVEGGDEMGFHGLCAHGMLIELYEANGLTYTEEAYDAAIEDAKDLGYIRVATFHGSESMHLDFEATKVTLAAMSSLRRMVKQHRQFFENWIFDSGTGSPESFVDSIAKVQAILKDIEKGARLDFDFLRLTASNQTDVPMIQ
jgi:hypothetical protein